MTSARPASTALSGLVLLLATALSGCGGDEESAGPPSSEPSSESSSAAPVTASETATSDAPDVPDGAAAEAAIQAYFDAMRAGDAAAVCALESENYQLFRDNETGQACLDDLGNNTAQPVWADPVVVVSLEVDGVGATAVLQPNAGSDAQATMALQATDGAWRVFSFA